MIIQVQQSQIIYITLNNPMAITGAEPVAYWPLGDNSNPNAPGSFPNISVGADSIFEFTQGNIIHKLLILEILFPLSNKITFTIWFNSTTTIGSDVGIYNIK